MQHPRGMGIMRERKRKLNIENNDDFLDELLGGQNTTTSTSQPAYNKVSFNTQQQNATTTQPIVHHRIERPLSPLLSAETPPLSENEHEDEDQVLMNINVNKCEEDDHREFESFKETTTTTTTITPTTTTTTITTPFTASFEEESLLAESPQSEDDDDDEGVDTENFDIKSESEEEEEEEEFTNTTTTTSTTTSHHINQTHPTHTPIEINDAITKTALAFEVRSFEVRVSTLKFTDNPLNKIRPSNLSKWIQIPKMFGAITFYIDELGKENEDAKNKAHIIRNDGTLVGNCSRLPFTPSNKFLDEETKEFVFQFNSGFRFDQNINFRIQQWKECIENDLLYDSISFYSIKEELEKPHSTKSDFLSINPEGGVEYTNNEEEEENNFYTHNKKYKITVRSPGGSFVFVGRPIHNVYTLLLNTEDDPIPILSHDFDDKEEKEKEKKK